MRFTLLISLTLFSSFSLCSADEVSLRSGESLSGNITSISPTGVVNLDYVYADEPFSIIPAAVKTCLFHPAKLPDKQLDSTVVTLTTGESFVGEAKAMDESTFTLDTTYAGKISIPLPHIDSIAFNQVKNRLVYSGPANDPTWENSVEWALEGNSLTANSQSAQYNDIKLPQNFILKFTYSWQEKPHLFFAFCDPNITKGLKKNRYIVYINKGGIELKRETDQGDQRWRPLAKMLSNPLAMPEKTVELELRVDRDKRKIHVFVNGVDENGYSDLVGDAPPAGTGIMIETSDNNGAIHTVSDIQVYEWDAVSQRQRSEDRSSEDSDSMVDDSGDIYTGKALGIKSIQGKDHMIFDHPHAKDKIQVPLNRISMLYLKKSQQQAENGDITLHLLSDTHFNVHSLELNDKFAKINHPILGSMNISRDTLQEVTRSDFSRKENQ